MARDAHFPPHMATSRGSLAPQWGLPMIRHKALCLLPAITLQTVASIQTNDIEWNAIRKLHWSDYRGQVPSNPEHSAITSYSVHSDSRFLDTRRVSHTVQCLFHPKQSWVQFTHLSDSTLLRHEQLHFDIAECNARALRSALCGLTSYSTLPVRVSQVRDSINTMWELVQANYDVETSHGTIIKKQALWAKKIAHTLDSLAAYSEPRFVVELKR